jgi:hypothetical protein
VCPRLDTHHKQQGRFFLALRNISGSLFRLTISLAYYPASYRLLCFRLNIGIIGILAQDFLSRNQVSNLCSVSGEFLVIS